MKKCGGGGDADVRLSRLPERLPRVFHLVDMCFAWREVGRQCQVPQRDALKPISPRSHSAHPPPLAWVYYLPEHEVRAFHKLRDKGMFVSVTRREGADIVLYAKLSLQSMVADLPQKSLDYRRLVGPNASSVQHA